jgi:hypothetical protein
LDKQRQFRIPHIRIHRRLAAGVLEQRELFGQPPQRFDLRVRLQSLDQKVGTRAIGASETSDEVHDALSLLGPEVIADVLARHAAGTLVGAVQDESKATRARKLAKADGTVDFAARDAVYFCSRVSLAFSSRFFAACSPALRRLSAS